MTISLADRSAKPLLKVNVPLQRFKDLYPCQRRDQWGGAHVLTKSAAVLFRRCLTSNYMHQANVNKLCAHVGTLDGEMSHQLPPITVCFASALSAYISINHKFCSLVCRIVSDFCLARADITHGLIMALALPMHCHS